MGTRYTRSDLIFTTRELRLEDVARGTGYFETLRNLSPAPVLAKWLAKKIFEANAMLGKTTWVAIDTGSGQIVGTVSFFIEYKYTRGGVIAGHIEDVVTRKGYEKLHIASKLMGCAIRLARKIGCYKAILDCSFERVGFYRKLLFREHETMMRRDFKKKKTTLYFSKAMAA